jgi:hypothetical protein
VRRQGLLGLLEVVGLDVGGAGVAVAERFDQDVLLRMVDAAGPVEPQAARLGHDDRAVRPARYQRLSRPEKYQRLSRPEKYQRLSRPEKYQRLGRPEMLRAVATRRSARPRAAGSSRMVSARN